MTAVWIGVADWVQLAAPLQSFRNLKVVPPMEMYGSGFVAVVVAVEFVVVVAVVGAAAVGVIGGVGDWTLEVELIESVAVVVVVVIVALVVGAFVSVDAGTDAAVALKVALVDSVITVVAATVGAVDWASADAPVVLEAAWVASVIAVVAATVDAVDWVSAGAVVVLEAVWVNSAIAVLAATVGAVAVFEAVLVDSVFAAAGAALVDAEFADSVFAAFVLFVDVPAFVPLFVAFVEVVDMEVVLASFALFALFVLLADVPAFVPLFVAVVAFEVALEAALVDAVFAAAGAVLVGADLDAVFAAFVSFVLFVDVPAFVVVVFASCVDVEATAGVEDAGVVSASFVLVALSVLLVAVPAFVPLFVAVVAFVEVALEAALVDSVFVDVSAVVVVVVVFASCVDEAAAGDADAVVVLASFAPGDDCGELPTGSAPLFVLFVEVPAVVAVLGEAAAVEAVEVSLLVMDAAGVGAAVGPSADAVAGMTNPTSITRIAMPTRPVRRKISSSLTQPRWCDST